MIVIASEAYRELIETCLAACPEEACGLLLTSGGPEDPIDGIRPVRNAHPRPDKAYRFDPADWVRAWSETRRSRRRIAGFYHSHPASPPVPSAADLGGWLRIADADFSYWIVSLRGSGRPEVAAWRLARGGDPGSPLVPAEIRVQIAERHDVARRDPL